MKTKGLAVSELIPGNNTVFLGDSLPCCIELSIFNSSHLKSSAPHQFGSMDFKKSISHALRHRSLSPDLQRFDALNAPPVSSYGASDKPRIMRTLPSSLPGSPHDTKRQETHVSEGQYRFWSMRFDPILTASSASC
jgi:hypothetical protein